MEEALGAGLAHSYVLVMNERVGQFADGAFVRIEAESSGRLRADGSVRVVLERGDEWDYRPLAIGEAEGGGGGPPYSPIIAVQSIQHVVEHQCAEFAHDSGSAMAQALVVRGEDGKQDGGNP